MKKTLFTISLLAALSCGAITSTYAGGAIGATEPTQILNNLQLIPTNLATTATALNTQLLSIKATILDPMANIMIAMSQLSTANGIINLVNGGFQGSSLIPADPRKYVDQQGLNVIKIGLGALASQQGGAYTQSLLGSLTNSFKTSSLTVTLNGINQSAIPSIVQKNACDDEMLSNLAKEDVTADGQAFDQTAYAERKKYFYEKFCGADPSTSSSTARALDALNKARPGIGGWDSWLAVTGGDNAYNATVRSGLALAEEQAKAKQAATDDLNRGRGVTSQKECLIRATTNFATGEAYADPSSAPCITDSVLNPSGLLQDSLTKAANSGLDRLANIQGADSLIGILTSIANLTAGIRTIGGAFGGGDDNTSTSTTTRSAPTNDLAKNPEQKKALINSIEKILGLHMKTMDELEMVDASIEADLQPYKAKLADTKACYADVAPGDPSAVALFTSRDATINTLEAKVQNDKSGITRARAYIQDMNVKLEAAQSTQVIQEMFDAYQTASQDMPSVSTLAERKADYAQSSSNARSDTGTGGELTKLYDRCISMQNQQTP